MTAQLFDFHGVHVQITALEPEGESTLAELGEDFRYFRGDFTGLPQIELRLSVKPAPPARFSRFQFKARSCSVHVADGGLRRCRYSEVTETIGGWNGSIRVMDVHSTRREELYEVAYMAVLSMTGEALDHRGFHRVHALGLQMHGKTALVILPQGGGKSALTALLMDKARFLSDEIPLLRDGRISPFPIRMALRPDVAQALGLPMRDARPFRRMKFPEKVLFSIPKERVGKAAPLDLILIGRHAKSPRIYATRRLRALPALMASMVIGIGVPQMAEHLLRWNAGLGIIGLSRLRTALRAVFTTPAFIFEVGKDARENARVLENFLAASGEK